MPFDLKNPTTKYILVTLLVIGFVVVVWWVFFKSSVPTVNTYSASAPRGDFWTVKVDSIAKTIAYTNYASKTSAVATYTVNTDGSFDVTDPTNNVTAALEIPGYSIILEAKKGGPDSDTNTLVIGILQAPITVASINNTSYNYMQFRTMNNSGAEIGYIKINGTSAIHGGYSPIDSVRLHGNDDDSTGIQEEGIAVNFTNADVTNKTYLTIQDTDNSIIYVFGSPLGFLSIDLSNGSIIGMKSALSAAFDPKFATTFTSLYYQKSNVQQGQGNTETGTIVMGKASIVVTTAAAVTVKDMNTLQTMFQGNLQPFSSVTSLYGTGKVNNPCYGLFVATNTDGSSFYVDFFDKSCVFSAVSPGSGESGYSYFYGAGLAK